MNAAPTTATAHALPGRAALAVLGILLALAHLWLFNWSEPTNNPNEMVRIHMVRAIAEHGMYAIGRRDLVQGRPVDSGPVYLDWGWVNDKAMVCEEPGKTPPWCSGDLYAGKAPGTSFLGVVPHLVLRAAFHAAGLGEPGKTVIVWWLRFTVVILPTLVAFLWLARHLTRRLDEPRLGLAVTLAAGLGSLSLTYSQMFAGHQPTAVALLACFAAIVAAGRTGRAWLVVLAGFAAAAAAVASCRRCLTAGSSISGVSAATPRRAHNAGHSAFGSRPSPQMKS